MNNLTIVKRLIKEHFISRSSRKIEYIVIHYFGSLGTALGVAKYFDTTIRRASAHYILDEGPIIYQCVEEKDEAIHCGTYGKYYNACRNKNSLGVEVRPCKLNKRKPLSADALDWYFDISTENNLVEFTKELMAKHNVDAAHVVRHYDVTGKKCPAPYVGDSINKYYGVSGKIMWEKFKRRLTTEESEGPNMDGKEIQEKLYKYLSTRQPSDYAKVACKKGVESGIFSDGDKNGLVDAPRAMVTREQLAVVLDRLGLLGE